MLCVKISEYKNCSVKKIVVYKNFFVKEFLICRNNYYVNVVVNNIGIYFVEGM